MRVTKERKWGRKVGRQRVGESTGRGKGVYRMKREGGGKDKERIAVEHKG